jgi:hypothetical protein
MGELMSDAIALLRRHFGAFYVLTLPFCAVDLLAREGGQSAFSGMRTVVTDPTKLDATMVLRLVSQGALGMSLLLLSLVVLTLLAAGITRHTASAYEGRVLVAKDALSSMAQRGAPLVVTGVLFLTVMLAIVLGVGVLGALGFIGGTTLGTMTLVSAGGIVLVLTVVLGIRWVGYTPPVVLEGLWGPAALKRAAALVAGRGVPFFQGAKFRLSVLYILVLLLSFTLQSLFVLPRLAMAWAHGATIADGMPPLASLPVWLMVPLGLAEVLTNALFMGFSTILTTLFYFDLRVRFEGLDLHDTPAATPDAA